MGHAEDNLSYYVLPWCEISSVSYMECADNKNDNFDDDTDKIQPRKKAEQSLLLLT